MSQDAQTDATSRLWWENISFPGKSYCLLQENGGLVLTATGTEKDRKLAILTPENAEAVTSALVERFRELEGKVAELGAEWAVTEDKLKLASKVARCREVLAHTDAIGDFARLSGQVSAWEQVINSLGEQNYQAKLALVQQAEALTDSDQWKEATQTLRTLSDQWKQTGFLQKNRNDELWGRLEAARDKFFERKRRYQEVQEKDMLQNLDLKMELVEKAEVLAASESWKETTEKFRELMDEWKATGRTLHDKNEHLWNRFIMAKQVFFDRKKQHFDQIQQQQEANYPLKLALVEKAEALRDSVDWAATAQAYAELTEQWKQAGRIAADKADELWARMSVAKEHFFQARRQHFESLRTSLEDNYTRKLSLASRAEALQHSTQWRAATDELNTLMAEWKTIGPVPREHSEPLWQQFLAARTRFFTRKDEDREQRKQQTERRHAERLQQTRQFLLQLREELKEEEDRMTDFLNGMKDITPGHKEEELRGHLQKLAAQSEQKIRRKQEKITDVEQQLEDLGKLTPEQPRPDVA